MHYADLPIILILSVYSDVLPLEFGKIQIFFLKFWQNADFFSGMQKGFLYIVFNNTDVFPKILIFLVIYTDFVLDQSGKPDYVAHYKFLTKPNDS